MPRFPHHSTPGILEQALESDLPGRIAQFQMAPLHRRSAAEAASEGPGREAAVLALFYPDRTSASERNSEPESHLLLTVRPPGMARHAGQVALPGGGREGDESLEQTALRETHEEVAIEPSSIRLIGRLSTLYVTPSRFRVTPFVGIIDEKPDMSVTSDEVDRVFGAALHALVRPETRKTTVRTIRGRSMRIPYFDLNGHIVWGATAMMLSELAALLNPGLLDQDPRTDGDERAAASDQPRTPS